MTNYSTALALGYATAIASWAVLLLAWPRLWPKQQVSFEQPWREVLWAFAGVLGVILLGQAYVAGFRLGGTGGLRVVAESVNQLVIFAPVLAIPFLRGQDLETAWIKRDRVWLRLAIGISLSLAAVAAFTALYGSTPWRWAVVGIYRPANAHIAAQVLFEDIAIAIAVVRLAAALGRVRAVALAGTLFAAAHVPAMIAVGATAAEFVALLRDAALGTAVVAIAIRAADVWVLWPIHFAMDMMQFVTSGRTP